MPTNLLITQWILITLRYFWYHLKGFLKYFWWPFRSSKSVEYSRSYSPDEVYNSYFWVIEFSSCFSLIKIYTKHPSYKDLDWDVLELLLVWVDKENSIEFPFNCGTLLIYFLCLLLFINSHASLLVVSFHMSANFLVKRKEKEKENK